MSSSPSALPTPRQLLTSILNQISEIPAPTATGAGNGPARSSSTMNRTDSFPGQVGEPPANPLRLIDARHRPLFTTLHVLFPSLLLPALDLLDRGLVTRLASTGGDDDAAAAPAGGSHPAPQEDGDARGTQREDGGGPQVHDPTAAATPAASASVYLVRSAQKPARRPYGGGGDAAAATSGPATTSSTSTSSQRTYVVHTAAWNCTCAAFAFSAFPPLAGTPTLLAPGHGEEEPVSTTAIIMGAGGDGAEDGEDAEGEGTGPCQFGGMSFDGRAGAGGVPPCCKHLLACVLAERWGCGLGRYVARREVGREEMAGVFADI